MREPSVSTYPFLDCPSLVIWVTDSTVGGALGFANHHKTATTIARAHPTAANHHLFCALSTGIAPVGALPVSDNASNAKARSEADWKRCSGFFSRQRCTTRCNP